MDKISGVSDDELILKILSFLPTKVAVSTSILSKHWKFLWVRVTKLTYDDNIIKPNSLESKRMRRFIATTLPLHPVIESLHLNLYAASFQPEDIKSWVEIAVSRCLRELYINYYEREDELKAILPSSLYTCKSLVTLKLNGWILVDVPRIVCLPSLKTLHLRFVEYTDEESLQRLLSNHYVLEDLFVELWEGDNVRKLAVIIPSLLSLSLEVHGSCTCDGYVMDTHFKAMVFGMGTSFFIANMPKLEKADLALYGFPDIKKLLEPITSVKRLSLYLHSTDDHVEVVSGDVIVFNELAHLKLSICNKNWSNLLLWSLESSPKLRDFEFIGNFPQCGMETSVCWKELDYVPQCLLSSLQTFKWTCYTPTTEERDLATYILRNSRQLKTASFLMVQRLDPQKKVEIENEFLSSSGGSTTCNFEYIS